MHAAGTEGPKRSRGKRKERIGVLKRSAVNKPGCLSDVLANDFADENAVSMLDEGCLRPPGLPEASLALLAASLLDAELSGLGLDQTGESTRATVEAREHRI